MSASSAKAKEVSKAELFTLSIAIALTLFGLGYAIFRLFTALGAQSFFNEWIVLLYRVALGNLAALGMKNEGNRASFWVILAWMVVTIIPIVNLLPIFFSGRFLAQKKLGLR